MSFRMKSTIAGVGVAAAMVLAAPLASAEAAPVADSGSSSIGCTSTDINPCPIRPLLDLITALTSGSADGV
ncbi:hypothetical protein [Nocardia rhizosphaerae]|uniref:Small secreted domain n=1 Tax=Nocardia rhizosphaerae TaxID=1691571 RepID=A0ABV8L5K9_9NOCA